MGVTSSPSDVLKHGFVHVKLAYNLWRLFTSSRIKSKCLTLAPISLFTPPQGLSSSQRGSFTPECKSAHGHLHTFVFGCLNVSSFPDLPILQTLFPLSHHASVQKLLADLLHVSSPGPRAEVSTTNKLDKVSIQTCGGCRHIHRHLQCSKGGSGAGETPRRSTWPHPEQIMEDLLEEVTVLIS